MELKPKYLFSLNLAHDGLRVDGMVQEQGSPVHDWIREYKAMMVLRGDEFKSVSVQYHKVCSSYLFTCQYGMRFEWLE